MATLVLRTEKGSALTYEEHDANFSNLNQYKLETTNNLSDLSNPSEARINLGIDTPTETLADQLKVIKALAILGL